MAKAKTKTKTVKTEAPDAPEPLAALKAQLAGDKFGYTEVQDIPPAGDEAYAIVWGRHQGRETPRILLVAVPPGAWARATPEYMEELGWTKPPSGTPQDAYPKFAAVSDGSPDRFKYFDLSSPPQEIDLPSLPRREESVELQQFHADPTYRWSMRMYDRLQKGFNAFHEQVYQTVKDRVNGKNDIILEVAKFLFLESFRLHHDGPKLEFRAGSEKCRLDQVFTAAYVKEHGKQAVTEIQAAFDHFKLHEDYVVTDDAGTKHPIFDAQTHLLLSQPRNYETLQELIQNLGEVTDNNDKVVKKKGSLRDVAGDVLGRAFDVFLRANFDSKGGIGIYLTPAPVKQCMLALAFHDILKETPELLTARNADGTPTFRFGDPACGTYGFGVVAMGYLRRTLGEILGRATGSDAARDKLFEQMCAHSFVGADSSPMMVTLARVNMALLGAPKAKIFYTQDSLMTEQLKPCSYDLICTNPPFGTAKFGKDEAEARERYEANREKILEKFRSDLKPREGRGGGLVYEPTVDGLAMGASPDKKGNWKPVGANSVDPAVLFLDRCLQLLKPGGRLLIILPDGVLCNSGDKYVREYILGKKDEQTGTFHGGKAIVKAVISLPADCFKLSGTGAKTSILYLQKRRARKDDPTHFEDQPQTDVFMAVADTLGYEVKNNAEDYSKGLPNDLATIEGAYKRGE